MDTVKATVLIGNILRQWEALLSEPGRPLTDDDRELLSSDVQTMLSAVRVLAEWVHS